MVKRYSKHLIGYGSLLFFVGLLLLTVDIITINIIIPISTAMVIIGTIGWITKRRGRRKEQIKYVSKVDQGLGFLWDNIIPKFWTGMILLMMIIFNPFASKLYKEKRNFLRAKELSHSYQPITSVFGSKLYFDDVNAWTYHNDTTTTYKFKIRGNKHGTEQVELTLSHGKKPQLIEFKILDE